MSMSAYHQEATWYLLGALLLETKRYAGYNRFPGNQLQTNQFQWMLVRSVWAFSSLGRWVSPQTGGVPLLHSTRNGSGRLLGLAILKIAAVPVSKAQTSVPGAPGVLGSGLAPQPIMLFSPIPSCVSLLLFSFPGRTLRLTPQAALCLWLIVQVICCGVIKLSYD